MASERERREARKLDKMASLSNPFEDFGIEIEASDLGDTLTEPPFKKLAGITKSPLYLLLMVKAPRFPLVAGDTLYVNVKRAGGHPMGSMTIGEDAVIRTPRGDELYSLASAAKLFQPWNRKKNRWPDGWEAIRYPLPEPGEYLSMNRLFSDYWERLEVPIDILLSEQKLAKHMVNLGYVDADTVQDYMMTPNTDKKTETQK